MTQLVLTQIELQNFQSVGNVRQIIRLDSEGLTLVVGSNSDSNGNHTRIGAGKTAILQALYFALYGASINGVALPNLVNNLNDRGMFVAVQAEKNGIVYRVERGRKPDIFKFYVNGVDSAAPALDEAQGTKKDTQKEIDRVFGMSKVVFPHIMGLNTYTDPYLKLGAPLQRAVVEELFGITLVADRAAILKTIYDASKKEYSDEEIRLRAFIDANTRIQGAIQQAEGEAQRWVSQQSAKMDALMVEVERLSTVDVAAAIAIFDALELWTSDEGVINSEIAAAQRTVVDSNRELRTLDAKIMAGDVDDPVPIREITRIEATNVRNEQLIENAKATIARAEAELAALAPKIDNPDSENCESCGQELTSEKHIAEMVARLDGKKRQITATIESNLSTVTTLGAEIKRNVEDLVLLKEVQIETRATRKEEAEKALSEKAKWEAELSGANSDIERLRASLVALGPRPIPTVSSRDAAYQMKSDFERKAQELENEVTRENPHLGRIESLQSTITAVDHTALDEIRLKIAHEEFLFHALTKKESFIRKRLIDRNLSKLNERLVHYLNLLGLPHEVSFVDDLSIEIRLFGKSYQFAMMSRGEGNKLILSIAWAFRDLWETLNFSINLWWIDELLDNGHDDATAELSLEVLKGMCLTADKNVFLVSHREIFNGAIDRTLTATKTNNFTTYEYQ